MVTYSGSFRGFGGGGGHNTKATFKGCLFQMGEVFVLAVVAEMITELIRFEPEICICNGNYLEFQRENLYM